MGYFNKNIVLKLEEKIIALFMLVAIIVGFMQVSSRFIFKSSLPWSEELLRFIFQWVTFLAASVAVREKAHVSVTFLIDKLPRNANKLITLLGILLSIGFCLAITYFGIQLVKVQIETEQISTAMQLPMWIPYSGVVVGSFMMAFRFFRSLLTVLGKRSLG
ncbi:MAG: C4-dicarboxylate transporter, DctQ subunit [Clostridia bacterium]|jgi:C4-dicarboxylate transporter DctQ subunit|nr:C4-dicarboxylate transporter, DctQ subunit [Clostridia bacterium]MDN5324230.1 C4-dicarboxylate transporter, DctQ subunit [Clostridia bacterium]